MPEAKAWPATPRSSCSDLLLESAAGGVLDAGVLELGRLAQPLLHVGGRLIDGHRHRAGARIRRLAGVDGASRKAKVLRIAFHRKALDHRVQRRIWRWGEPPRERGGFYQQPLARAEGKIGAAMTDPQTATAAEAATEPFSPMRWEGPGLHLLDQTRLPAGGGLARLRDPRAGRRRHPPPGGARRAGDRGGRRLRPGPGDAHGPRAGASR